MMLTILLPGLLGIAAVLATSSMIVTWLQYASAWDRVDAQMRHADRTPVRPVTVRVVRAEPAAVPVRLSDFRAGQFACWPATTMRAAA